MNLLSSLLVHACLLFATAAVAQTPAVPIGPGGGNGGGGTVTSIATSCGISGGPVTTTGTLSGSITTNPQTGTTYTQLATDCGKLLTFTNASSIAVTLSSTNFTAGNHLDAIVLPSSVGSATFTPSSGTVNGQASIILAPGSPGGTFVFDGTNWEFSGVGLTQHKINVVTFSLLAKASTAAFVAAGSGYVTNDTITMATTGGGGVPVRPPLS